MSWVDSVLDKVEDLGFCDDAELEDHIDNNSAFFAQFLCQLATAVEQSLGVSSSDPVTEENVEASVRQSLLTLGMFWML